MARSEWKWYGNAGHFCLGHECRFHLATEIEGYMISTVGELVRSMFFHSSGGYQEIGAGRLYETAVFELDDPVQRCNAKICGGCGRPNPSNWNPIELVEANTAKEATDNHYMLCKNYDKEIT